MVSGLASLLLSQNRDRTAEEIKTIIKQTARDRSGETNEDKSGWDMYYGYGRIDCFLALTYNDENLRNKIENVNKNRVEHKVTEDNDDDNTNENDGGAKAIKEKTNVKNSSKDKPARKK